MTEFREWPKIPRGGAGELITITEKIDGTNACIIVEETYRGPVVVGVQSRTQLLADADNDEMQLIVKTDNSGFADWVVKNQDELAKLGEGYHYGEWAGPGIQKNHHNLKEKTFFLFNSDRWRDGRDTRPAITKCVPILYEGPIGPSSIDDAMNNLWADAKEVGFFPEGVVVWYHKTRRYEKYTFENAEGKWKAV